MTTPPHNIQISQPSVGREEWEALREPLETGWLTQGPKVREFEAAFASRHSVEHAVATTSCTTALHVALLSLGIGPGDEVIVPAFTFVATANAVVYCGARPIFADVEGDTYNISVDSVADRLSDRTRAVLAVHLFGLCADMASLGRVIPPGVELVEDAACAAGATFCGRSAGSIGHVACFSFHPRKSITTGEGGMITTNDTAIAAAARRLRDHGMSSSSADRHRASQQQLLPPVDELGYNYRMTDLQASIGIVQLSKLDHFVAERARLAERYRQGLGDLEWLRLPADLPDSQHAWQSFVTVLDGAPLSRDTLMTHLTERGIATRPGTHAVTELGYYQRSYGVNGRDYPVASRLHRNTMAFPLHNRMTDDDVDEVVDEVRSAARTYARS